MAIDKDVLMGDYWHRGCWKLALQRIDSHRDDLTIKNLKGMLEGVSPGDHDLDTPRWRWERKGYFLVYSTYHLLVDGGLRMEYGKFIWEMKCPLKVQIFLWVVAKVAILTWNHLQTRGWEGPNHYALCTCMEENEYHLLLSCPHSTSVWRKCVALFNVQFDWTTGSSVWSWLRGGHTSWGLGVIVIATIYWNLWRERHNRIFRESIQFIDNCVFHTHLDIILWVGQLSDRERLCISKDGNCYLQEKSPTLVMDTDGNRERKEWYLHWNTYHKT